MYMNVTAFIMTIRVGADQSLMSGEIISGILQTELLRPFSGQAVFCHIPRIKT